MVDRPKTAAMLVQKMLCSQSIVAVADVRCEQGRRGRSWRNASMAAFRQTARHQLSALSSALDSLAGKIPVVGGARRRSSHAHTFPWYAPSPIAIGATGA